MLILTVVYSAYVGGLGPALVSVAVLLYALHYFAEPGLPLHYSLRAGASLVVVGGSTLIAGTAGVATP